MICRSFSEWETMDYVKIDVLLGEVNQHFWWYALGLNYKLKYVWGVKMINSPYIDIQYITLEP